MTRTPEENMLHLAKLAGEMVEAIVEQEVQVAHLVQAEIKAFEQITRMPDRKATEAKTEAAFDNMPV